ncbi:hypothetical protein VTO73DRAFT_14484 [Trametes versicolor]
MATLFDILGVVFGILGTTLLRQLEAVVIDIESLLSDLAQHGVVFKCRREYQERVDYIKKNTRKATLRSYQVTTYFDQLRALCSGLSKEVAALYDEAVQLRASICTAAISAQDASTLPHLPFWEPLTTDPVTSPIPEPPYTPPVIITPPNSRHKFTAPLRPALRKPISHHRHARDSRRAESREGKPRPRAQSLPPALHNTHPRNKTLDHSEAEASGVDDVDVDAEQGGLRRRSLGQRKVQFDKYVSVLEFESSRVTADTISLKGRYRSRFHVLFV